VDSPVYTFLPDLVPPSVRGAIAIGAALMAPDQPTAGAPADNPTFTVLLEAFRAARKKGDFLTAKAYVEKLRESKKDDPYLVQQHALMTYKSRTPNIIDALREARQILETLQPERAATRKHSGCGARFTSGSGRKRRIAARSTKASPRTNAGST